MTNIVKVAVFGNRKLSEEQTTKVASILQEIFEAHPIVLLSGGADGVSRVAEAVCEGFNKPVVIFKPWNIIWNKLPFNPILFYLRNKQVVENADKILIISTGEEDSEVHRVVELCERKEKDFKVLDV
jgi:hypothetical protein